MSLFGLSGSPSRNIVHLLVKGQRSLYKQVSAYHNIGKYRELLFLQRRNNWDGSAQRCRTQRTPFINCAMDASYGNASDDSAGKKNRETYEPFIEDEVPFDEYCQSMEKDGTWAGHMEIQAASLVTHSNICIHQKMSPRWYIQNFDNREAQMIHLSYHDEEHYNSVRLKEDTCSGAARPVTIKADVDISTKSHQAKVSVTKSKGKADKNIIQAGSVKMVMVGSGCENYQKAEQVLLLMPQFLITEQGSEESLVENDNFSFSAGISHGENQNDNPVPHKAEVDDNTEKRGQSCDNIERTRDNNILQQFEKIIPSRNKACPCGSKKKYKSCCGSVAGRSSAKFAINQTVDYGEGRKNKKQGKKSGANNVVNSHVSEGEPPDVGALCI